MRLRDLDWGAAVHGLVLASRARGFRIGNVSRTCQELVSEMFFDSETIRVILRRRNRQMPPHRQMNAKSSSYGCQEHCKTFG